MIQKDKDLQPSDICARLPYRVRPPKKIYIDDLTGEFDDHWNTYPNNNSIEYVCKDAFIEKACKWFRDIDYDDSIPPFETTEEFIEGFKNYMKGE